MRMIATEPCIHLSIIAKDEPMVFGLNRAVIATVRGLASEEQPLRATLGPAATCPRGGP